MMVFKQLFIQTDNWQINLSIQFYVKDLNENLIKAISNLKFNAEFG